MDIASFVTSASEWMFDATWKASAVALLVLAAQWLFRGRLPASWRHALWLLVLIRLLIPALPESRWSLFGIASIATQSEKAEARTAGHADISLIPNTERVAVLSPVREAEVSRWDLRTFASILWLSVALLFMLKIMGSGIVFAYRLRGEKEVADGELRRLLLSCQELVGVHQTVRIVETELVKTPAVMGLFRPTLLMPRDSLRALTPQQLKHVFLHELAHLRRGDPVWNGLLSLLQIVHWPNLSLHWVFRRMRADCEEACDALVLSRVASAERPEYGRTIVCLLERLIRPGARPGLVGILGDSQRTKRRIQMIVRYKKASGKVTLLAAAMTLALGAIALTEPSLGTSAVAADTALSGIEGQLAKPIDVDMKDASLSDALKSISSVSGVKIDLSRKLAREAKDVGTVCMTLVEFPADDALRHVLRLYGLTYSVDGRKIKVEKGENEALAMIPEPGGQDLKWIEKNDGDGEVHKIIKLKLDGDAEEDIRKEIELEDGDVQLLAAPDGEKKVLVEIDEDGNKKIKKIIKIKCTGEKDCKCPDCMKHKEGKTDCPPGHDCSKHCNLKVVRKVEEGEPAKGVKKVRKIVTVDGEGMEDQKKLVFETDVVGDVDMENVEDVPCNLENIEGSHMKLVLETPEGKDGQEGNQKFIILKLGNQEK